eukprot:Tbor_TRINITY_DN1129_c0_g1::TRINITY_DN1129_c0_g1_i1::g.15555::m.15555
MLARKFARSCASTAATAAKGPSTASHHKASSLVTSTNEPGHHKTASIVVSQLRFNFNTQVRFETTSGKTIGSDVEAMTVEKVWALWNEGNLFSMNLSQLHSFLNSQNITFDQGSKKAALIRQVEEFLQARDSEQKGGASGGGGQQDQYGRWQGGSQPQQEVLLDLKSAAFYENQASMAPKAFQLLVHGNNCDLVVSRVNTTSFPGFPSSTECYTLSGAIADLAIRARFSKALQWCVMNIRNLSIQGEFAVDFGKMILKEEILRKKRRLVSGWTLQQRAQLNDPYHWISTVSKDSTADFEALLEKEKFVRVENNKGQPAQYFDVHIRRKADTIHLELDTNGNPLSGHEMWYPIQRSHILSQIGGQDVRLQLRTRNPLPNNHLEVVRRKKVLEISGESVNPCLPAEMGQVTYTSENRVRCWEKKGDKGIVYTLRQIERDPLVITNEEDNDPRFEVLLTTVVPVNVDMNWFANDLFDLSKRMADVLTPHFISTYGTEVKPITIESD